MRTLGLHSLGLHSLDLRTPEMPTRDVHARELMDEPDCDLEALRRTYAQFRAVNRLVAGWRRVYASRIRPLLSASVTTTLLDIGSGGGDVARGLDAWARRDRLLLDVTGIDPDPRAHQFATELPPTPTVRFRQATTAELIADSAHFDLVISNHLLHHLDDDGLAELLDGSRRLARRLVVHNDIERSRWAYASYAVGAHIFGRRSFVRPDGLVSIRRSHRAKELKALVDDSWQVVTQVPARLLLLWDAEVAQSAAPIHPSRMVGR